MTQPNRTWRLLVIALFPALVAVFGAIYRDDPFRYIYLLREDGPVEWMTFAFLALAGLIALDIGIVLYQRHQGLHWFFFAFGLFCLVMAFEEISWGQRLFALTPPEYFLGNSDQQEINVHNVLQQKLDFKTKDLAALVLSFYGILLPLAAINRTVSTFFERVGLVVPPLYLTVGFVTATLLMFDVPSGFEEEIGECLFGLAFLLFMLHELAIRETVDGSGERTVDPRSRGSQWIDRIAILAIILLAFGIQIGRLDAKGLWLAEAVNLAASSAPLPEQAGHAWFAAGFELPIWPLFLGLWQPLTGSSEFALRFLASLASTMAVALLWVTVRTVWPRQVALRILAALLLATSPALQFFAQDLSPYAMAVALAVLSLYLTVCLLERTSITRLCLWMAVCWLLTFAHLFAIVLIGVEALLLVWTVLRREEGGTRRGWHLLLVIGALVPGLGWLLFAPGTSQAVVAAVTIVDPEDWSYSERLAQLWKDLLFGNLFWQSFRARLSVVIAPLFLTGILVLLNPSTFRLLGRSRLPAAYLAWLLPGSAVVAALIAIFGLSAMPSSAMMVFLPGLLITVAAGAIFLWRSVRLVGLVAILLAIGIGLTGLVTYADDAYAKSDYRTMSRFLQTEMNVDDGLLLTSPSQHFLADYYLPEAAAAPVPAVALSPYWPQRVAPLVPHEVDGLIQEALQRHPALWLLHYDEESVDPGRFLQPYLTAVSYRDHCIEWRDVELCRYVSPKSVQPSSHQLLDLIFDQSLRLGAIDLAIEGDSISGAEAILAELDWEAVVQPGVDFKVSLRLLDRLGTPVAQRDDFPIGPLLPPTTWVAGDEKPGYLALPLPQPLPVGSYSLELVVYDPNEMRNVSYSMLDGGGSDAPVVLGVVDVGEGGAITYRPTERVN